MSSTQRVRYLIEAVNTTAGPFKDAEEDLKRLNKSRLQANTLVFAEQRAQQFLLATYRMKYSAVYDTLSLMRSVGTIGNQIISIVNAENLSQIRLRDTLLDVEEAQLRLNTALGLFGEDSVQYQAALADLEKAQDRYADAANADKWKDLGIATSIVGLISNIGTLTMTAIPMLIRSLGAIPTSILVSVSVYVIGMELLEALNVKLQEYLAIIYGATAPVTTKKPGAPGTTGIWPGVYVDEDLIDWYKSIEDTGGTTIGPGDGTGGGGVRDGVGGGGDTIIVDVDVDTDADPDQIADAVVRAIRNGDRVVR